MSDLIYTVSDIFATNTNTMKGCLQQYGCSAFRIPSYQRGYKWGSEDNQPVERLLSDLYKAWSDDAKEYLLQAITVKKLSNNSGASVLEVIDGQQRLTTLFILCHALNIKFKSENNVAAKLQYSIRHEEVSIDSLITDWIHKAIEKDGTYNELKATFQVEIETRQDYYYLKCAVLRCVYELSRRSDKRSDDNEKGSGFSDFVLRKTKLLVNAVEPHVEGEVIFGNLNSNRVSLTEKELIKGLLLTKVARESTVIRSRRYREILEARIYLGRKWDEISRWASQPTIKNLFFSASDDGVSGLLKLVAMQMSPPYEDPVEKKAGTNPLFEYFLGCPHQEPVFDLLTSTYAALADWYDCKDDYHLLGYCLINHEESKRMQFLVDHLKLPTKKEFRANLRNIRTKILYGNQSDLNKTSFETLNFEETKDHIHKIFLALSVFRGQERSQRFDFFSYQNEHWTLEHIFPQTPFGKDAKLNDIEIQATIEMLICNEGQVLAPDILTEISNLNKSNITYDDKKSLIESILKRVKTLHRIGNLCLLSRSDNSSVGCRMFKHKRKEIRDRIAQGSFVPLHTYEVFCKMIVGENTNLEVWSIADIVAHEKEIYQRIQALIKETI